ncbi:shikimate dehydrogenase [Legionella norrlandica]|uniref:Shikimate dehydrogenase (NADP(+)) n=1 Tax=Legionella norrlandica TaxID=1498499 RepID=A0A0A2TA81_9GAMM|nr:shikimate dehydrogenase [Legionella norrlandica]KGP64323.1 shikimate dehydrogenase [Legionella norrlandica]
MSCRFAVIGNPIAHSLSPAIHQLFAQQTQVDLTYEKILGDDITFEQQVSYFFNNQGKGLNVTLPYKQRAYELAKVHTTRCILARAANTLWIKNNQLHADNTDGIGLIRDLTRFLELTGKKILILGAGGAARGIIYPLLETKPLKLTIANRTLKKAEELQCQFPQINITSFDELSGVFDLIINATSASLSNQIISLPGGIWSSKPFCYDLAYSQSGVTSFVTYALNKGCKAIDGLGMLVEQAAEAFCIWNGIMPSTNEIIRQLRSF